MVSVPDSLPTAVGGPARAAIEREYYSISEAAALLGVSRVSIWRWIRDGRLPAARLGHRTARIRRQDIEQALTRLGPAGARGWVVRDPGDGAGAEQGARGVGAPRSDLRATGPSEHFAQFYESDGFLLDAVRDFIGAGIRAGESAVVIATQAHREGVEERLEAAGLAVAAARAQGRYVSLDAAETLSRLMVDGAPEPARFARVVGGIVARAAEGGRRVRVFGEMVALLALEGDPTAAVRLEELWNELRRTRAFSLFCAYPMEALGGEAFAGVFGDVCAEHARVIPAESYSALAGPDDRLREIALLQQKAASLEAEVAERKRAEERLRQSERELRDFVENATEGLHWVGPDGRIIWANRAELELLGYAAETYIGRHIAEFHADPDVIADILDRPSGGEELRNYPARLRARDGSIKHVLINSNVYREDGRFVHTRCFTRDVTDRMRAEEAAGRLAAIVESSDDAIIGKTLDGVIVDWNRGAERLYGYAAAEVVGRPISLIMPEDRPDEFPAILARLRRGERIDHYETQRVTRDGRRLDVSVTISPVRDADGRLVGASAVARDISERKQAEREREALLARERQARAEAEAALRLRDEFLSVAAHELRTPLATLKGHAQVAVRRLERAGQLEPERVSEALRAIASQSDKLNRLLGHLLDISRLEAGKLAPERQPTDLAALVGQAVAGARARSDRHPITLATPPSLVAEVDPLRLEQVLTNLLDNAIKYSPQGGAIEVAVSRSADGAPEITVRDHGSGIPPEKRGRLFERFFQAHADGYRSGLGLGLYISQQIVEQHGGELRAEFPSDGGTRFVVRLPIGAGERSAS